MPHFPKRKPRPWTPRRTHDHKGLKPTTRSTAEHVQFYNSKRWRSLSAYYRAMNPLCELCEKAGYIVPGRCVDHIVPMRLGGNTISLTNLQTLCLGCHASKSGKESHISPDKKINL